MGSVMLADSQIWGGPSLGDDLARFMAWLRDRVGC
jgi:hypothetical protein